MRVLRIDLLVIQRVYVLHDEIYSDGDKSGSWRREVVEWHNTFKIEKVVCLSEVGADAEIYIYELIMKNILAQNEINWFWMLVDIKNITCRMWKQTRKYNFINCYWGEGFLKMYFLSHSWTWTPQAGVSLLYRKYVLRKSEIYCCLFRIVSPKSILNN